MVLYLYRYRVASGCVYLHLQCGCRQICLSLTLNCFCWYTGNTMPTCLNGISASEITQTKVISGSLICFCFHNMALKCLYPYLNHYSFNHCTLNSSFHPSSASKLFSEFILHQNEQIHFTLLLLNTPLCIWCVIFVSLCNLITLLINIKSALNQGLL